MHTSVLALLKKSQITMQKTSKQSLIENIVWKYCKARRSRTTSLLDALDEIAVFLFKHNGADTNNLVYAVCYALGYDVVDTDRNREIREECEYHAGILSSDEEAILLNSYPEVMEMIVTPPFNGAEYRNGGQPDEITNYVAGLFKELRRKRSPINEEENFSEPIFNPYSGLGSYALALPEYRIVGEEPNRESWALSRVRLHAHGVDGSSIWDEGEDMWKSQYKSIISTIPMGAYKNRSDQNIIERLYNVLLDEGQMVVVVSSEYLFGYSTKSIRNRLLADRTISKVILLPEGLFSGTNTQAVILAIEKRPHASVEIIDASSAFRQMGKKRLFDEEALHKAEETQSETEPIALSFDYGEIIDNGGVLDPRLLLTRKALNSHYMLSNLATIAVLTLVAREVVDAPVLLPSSLSAGFARTPIDVSRVERKTIKRSSYYIVNEPAVIVDYQCHSDQLRLAYVDRPPVEPLYVSDKTIVLYPNETISPQFLMLVLLDSRVKRQWAAVAAVAAFPRNYRFAVASVHIPYYSAEEQDRMVLEAMRSSMSQTEKDLEDAYTKYKREIKSRKHALSQSISAVSALWRSFDAYCKDNEIISQEFSHDTIGRRNPMSVTAVCAAISNYLTTISAQTDAIADASYNWGGIEWIGLPLYTAEYIQQHNSPNYLLFDSNDKTYSSLTKGYGVRGFLRIHPDSYADNEELPLENVKFPRKALDRILDNIIANAVSHGFIDNTRDDYKICFDRKEEDGAVALYISNNGAPIPPDLVPEEVLEYGRSTVLNENGHSGLGGYEVASIMERFGGRVEILSTPDEEYTVTYKLVFTVVSRYLPSDEIG